MTGEDDYWFKELEQDVQSLRSALQQSEQEVARLQNRTCEWIKLSMTGEDDYWHTHCMEHGAKGDAMLIDRLWDYCPNCGGKVEVEL